MHWMGGVMPRAVLWVGFILLVGCAVIQKDPSYTTVVATFDGGNTIPLDHWELTVHNDGRAILVRDFEEVTSWLATTDQLRSLEEAIAESRLDTLPPRLGTGGLDTGVLSIELVTGDVRKSVSYWRPVEGARVAAFDETGRELPSTRNGEPDVSRGELEERFLTIWTEIVRLIPDQAGTERQ